jgi:hypothetical protein
MRLICAWSVHGQESGNLQLVLMEPTYPPTVLARQAVRATAISERVTKMITNLEKQLEVIEKELLSDPDNLNL